MQSYVIHSTVNLDMGPREVAVTQLKNILLEHLSESINVQRFLLRQETDQLFTVNTFLHELHA